MVTLPEFSDLTLQAVDQALIAKQEQRKQRGRLYFSQIGRECEREIWYNVNDYSCEPHNAQTLRRFEDGQRGESLMAERLRLVGGVELWTHDENGEQYKYSDFNNRFSGRIDGAIIGLVEAPKTLHCWECKVTNEKKFSEFQKIKSLLGEKNTLEKWDFSYYATAILYMHYGNFDRHYLTVCTPGGRDYSSCRTESNNNFAKHLIQKAKRILESKEPPQRISENKSFYKCKICNHYATCWK